MKLNRKWLLLVALVLSVAMATTGTLAYLTDEDKDVNTMTLGKVEIVQNEQKWNEDKTELIEYKNDEPLYPYIGQLGWTQTDYEDGAYRQFTMKNVQDKYVTVTNTGKSDAYVRTIIAAEMGEYTTVDEFRNKVIGFSRNVENGDEFKFPGAWVWENFQVVELEDGNNYLIMTAVHQNPVKPGETTIPSLLQVYMNKECDNEEVEKVDGNKNGKYDIIALSQAIQVNGFEEMGPAAALNEGFGEVTEENLIKWLAETEIGSPNGDKNDTNNPPKKQNGDDDNVTFAAPADAVRVTSVAELEEAVNNGATTLLLAAGDYTDLTATVGKNLKLYGESKDTVLYTKYNGGEGADYDFDGSTVEFYNLTISADKYVSNGNYYPGYARMNGTYNDCVINGMYTLYGPSSFNYCTLNITGDQYNIWTWGAGTATFDHCTFNTDGKSILVYSSSCDLTVSNCVFNDSEALAPVKAAIETGSDSLSAIYHNIIVNNTDVNGFAINKTKCDEVNTTLWANKNGMDHDHLNVVVDGVDVY